jgi:hypothetical protein
LRQMIETATCIGWRDGESIQRQGVNAPCTQVGERAAVLHCLPEETSRRASSSESPSRPSAVRAAAVLSTGLGAAALGGVLPTFVVAPSDDVATAGTATASWLTPPMSTRSSKASLTLRGAAGARGAGVEATGAGFADTARPPKRSRSDARPLAAAAGAGAGVRGLLVAASAAAALTYSAGQEHESKGHRTTCTGAKHTAKILQ